MRKRIAMSLFVPVVLAGLTAMPTTAGDQYVQMAMKVPAGDGTMWLTDLVVQNVSDQPVELELAYLCNTPEVQYLTIAAGAAQYYADVVGTVFGLTGKIGALRISDIGNALRITSRSYDQAASGTYGVFVPAEPASAAFPAGETATLIQLTKSSSLRTKIYVFNPEPDSVSVEIQLYDSSATLLGSLPFSAEPEEVSGFADVFASIGDVEDAYALVTANGRFMTHAWVVDNGTSDAWVVPGQREPSAVEALYIPVAMHDSSWVSDVEVKAAGASSAGFELALLPSGQDNSSPAVANFALGAGTCMRFVDVLQSVFGFTGTAALRITPTSGNVLVTSRLYYADPPTGTYSRFVAARPVSEAFTSSQTATLGQLSSSGDFVSHVGWVNTTGSTLAVDVKVYSGDGSFLSTFAGAALPYEQVELSEVVCSGVANCFALVKTTTSSGALLPYATVLDTRTQDGIHVPGLMFEDTVRIFADDFESADTSAWSRAAP